MPDMSDESPYAERQLDGTISIRNLTVEDHEWILEGLRSVAVVSDPCKRLLEQVRQVVS